MENNITKLFVYGTLRRGFRNPAYEYISKHFSLIGEAKVQGKLYDVGEYPAAMPAVGDFFIKGELYELNEADEFEWAIEQLDDYEGLNPEEGETPLYIRKLAEVFYNHTSAPAWIYWYNKDLTGLPQIPSGDIFDWVTNKLKL